MAAIDATVQSFFAEYAAGFNRALADPADVDVDGVTAAFAACFVEASPAAVNCGSNDDQFRANSGGL
jgi:hypothetical protein